MKALWIGVIAIVVLLAAWAYVMYSGKTAGPAADETLIASAVYRCDGGKWISAAYFEGPPAPEPAPGEPPTPTGYVEVSLDGGATTTLRQTISASGVRYANADESFVFWNKGDEALIMRDNAMDLTYTNCRDAAGDR